MPNINIENPNKKVPTDFLLDRFPREVINIITPINANIGEKDSGFKSLKKKFVLWIPDKLNIHAVSVVPTLEPIITYTVCPKPKIPELTRPTNITVSAEDDWIAIVITAPSKRLLKRLEVIFLRTACSLPPATFSRLPDIICIPKRKNARPPHNVNTE
jgi:hypothetical protein